MGALDAKLGAEAPLFYQHIGLTWTKVRGCSKEGAAERHGPGRIKVACFNSGLTSQYSPVSSPLPLA